MLPKWTPTWDMRSSTMLYTCNHSGFHNASYAAQFGVVSYDWSNAKQSWAQDHPMTCEEALTKQAEMVLAEMKVKFTGLTQNSQVDPAV
jgi:hypothetical protein